MKIWKGHNNELIYNSSIIPCSLDSSNDRYDHRYYSQMRVHYKENDKFLMRKTAMAFIEGRDMITCEGGMKEMNNMPDPDMGCYDKTIKEIGEPSALNGNINQDVLDATLLEEAAIVHIPYIEANELFINEPIPGKCKKLIIHAHANKVNLLFDGAMQDPSVEAIEELWVYGDVKMVNTFPYAIDLLRVPYSVESIRCSNATEIVGVNDIVKGKKDGDELVIVMDDPHDMNLNDVVGIFHESTEIIPPDL